MNSRTTPTGLLRGYAVMQKLSQARSELRLAAASDKGIQKLQFLKVRRQRARTRRKGRTGVKRRVEFSHRLRPTSSEPGALLCASLHAPPVKDSGNATATASESEREREKKKKKKKKKKRRAASFKTSEDRSGGEG